MTRQEAIGCHAFSQRLRHVRSWIAAAAFLAFTGGALASDQLVLGVANNSGRQTRVSITNRASSTAQVTLSFVPVDPSAAASPTTITILPMAAMVYTDVLGQVWGLSGQQGVLRVTSANALAIAAGKYVAEDSGRAGSPLPVVFPSDLVAASASGDLRWISQSSDPTSGLSTNIEVYADAPGTQANLVLFDAGGNQIASQAIAGGPMVYEIPVASLAPGGVPTARAELRVSAGTATASVEVSDNATGNWSVASLLAAGTDGADLVIASSFQLSDLGAAQLQTDVRLFNENQSAATITAQFGTSTYTGSIPPLTLVETTDILGSWFGVTGVNQGEVEIHSTLPLLAMQRTVAASMSPDATGPYFSFEAVPKAQPALTAGSTGVIGGLRGGGAQMALSARAGPSADLQANVALRDTTGQILAQVSLAVLQGQAQLQTIGDLFAGVTVPDDGILELTALSGDLDAAIFSVDAGTGDVDYLQAWPSAVDSPCAPPQILSVDASAQNLSQPASVTFDWVTRLADSVALQPVANSLDPSSSYTAQVSASTVFQLVATNSCGTASASIPVSVGSPAVTSISVPAPSSGSAAGSSGQPGQIFQVSLGNVGDPSAVSGLVLRQGTAIEMAIALLGFSPDGTPYARIPLLPDPTAPSGYRTGAFTVTAVVNGQETPAAPLNILPFASIADPVAAFQSLLDGISAAGKQGASDLQGPAGSAAVQAAMTTSSLLEADLRQMLASISSSGQGSLTQGLRLQASSSTPSVMVSRNDLAAVLALNANYLASAPPVTPAAPSTAASGTCLDQKQPYLPVCRSLEAALQNLWQVADAYPQVFNDADLNTAFQQSQTAGVAYMTQKLQSSSMQGVLRKVNLWTTWLSVLCVLEPIRLERFDILPSVFAVGYPNGTVTATKINAVLEPKYQGQALADALVSAETQKLVSQLPQKYNSQQFPIGQSVQPAVQSLFGDLSSALTAFVQKYATGLPASMSYQVGMCDIANLYAQSNGPQEDQYDESSAILIPVGADDPSWGRDTFYFQALRAGVETMCIQLYGDHFLVSPGLQAALLQPPALEGQLCAAGTGTITMQPSGRLGSGRQPMRPRGIQIGNGGGVSVVGYRLPVGFPALFVTDYEVNAWCQCPDENPTGITSPGADYSGGLYIAYGAGLIVRLDHREANAVLAVRQFNARSFEATLDMTTAVHPGTQQVSSTIAQSLAKVTMTFNNPVARYNAQAIEVEVFPDNQSCQRPFAYDGFFSGTAGQVSDNRPAQNPAVHFRQIYSGATSGQLTLTLGGEADGFNIQTGVCSFRVDVSLLAGL